MIYFLAYILCWLPLKIFLPIKIIGKKNLLKGKAILCCNHHSNWDFAPIYYIAKSKLYVLCKDSLFKNKFFAFILTRLRGIAINREKPEISSIKKCLTVLNNNNNLLIFPEGTRTKEEEMSSAKGGVGMFCIKTYAPIIPMMYEKKNKIFRRNRLIIGEPIYFNLEYSKENIQVVTERLELEMNNLKKTLEESKK